MAEAIARRCFWPPDSEAGWRALSAVRSSRASISSAAASSSSGILMSTSSSTLSVKSWCPTSCMTI